MTYLADHHVPAPVEYANHAAEAERHIGEKIRQAWLRSLAIFRRRSRGRQLDGLASEQLAEIGLCASDVERSALGELSVGQPRGFSHHAMLGSPFGR